MIYHLQLKILMMFIRIFLKTRIIFFD
jgi:hypothetical protein